ncbi:MAG: type II toxin-antitoxin system VapC family toxin [Candidatus Bathyarchaeia archaeon]
MEKCREVVLDSSVVVKWFSAEVKTDAALKLRDSYVQGSMQLTISEVLVAEVANALRYKPDYDTEKLRKALAGLLGLHLNVVHLNEGIVARTVEIAYEGKVTFYDALPVAIAERRKTVCVTADEETQFRKLQPKGHAIELL